jgi:hypothetical protein
MLCDESASVPHSRTPQTGVCPFQVACCASPSRNVVSAAAAHARQRDAQPGSSSTRTQEAARTAAPTAEELHTQKLEQLRSELETCKLGALTKRASADGVAASALEDALDAEDIKGCVIELILAQQPQEVAHVSVLAGAAVVDAGHVLRLELSGLKMSSLKRRAMQSGVAESSLDEAEDSDQPTRQLIIDMIVAAQRRGLAGGVAEETVRGGALPAMSAQHARQRLAATRAQRPHHGSSALSPRRPAVEGTGAAQHDQAAPVTVPPPTATRSSQRCSAALLGGKHAMLSCHLRDVYIANEIPDLTEIT